LRKLHILRKSSLAPVPAGALLALLALGSWSGCSSNSLPRGTVARGETFTGLDRYLSRAAGLGYSAAVLVAKDGEVVFQKGYGMADRERGIPITPETLFDIGSITKQFTAAAILKLEEEGRLKVSDPITKYFDNVPEDKRSITLHQLLTHSAGLALYSGDDYEVVSRETMVQRTLEAGLLFPPGTKWEYSNPAYSLLAAIVEKLSGQPYETFVRERFFERAGMRQTGYVLPKWNRDEVARGYANSGYRGTPLDQPWAPDGPSWNLRGNGGMLSTVGDLYRWHLALERGDLLSPESREKSAAPQMPTGRREGEAYGYGWFITTTPRNTRLVAHSGGNGTFAVYLNRYVDEGVVLVTATNDLGSEFRGVAPNLSRIIFGDPPPELPAARARIDPQTLRQYAGRYAVSPGREFEIALDRGQLVVRASSPVIGRLLTRLPELPAGEAEKVRDVEALAKRIFLGIDRGDLEPIREVLWTDMKIEEEKTYWDEAWPKWKQEWGAFQGTEVLGTQKSGDLLNTYVLVHFERGSRLVYLQQKPGGRFFVNTSTGTPEGRLLPPLYRFVPQSETEFATWNFTLGTEARLRFRIGEGGVVEALVVQGPEGEVLARRVSSR
jgi:CubicO group peptidase (beta-lactamase class C family)